MTIKFSKGFSIVEVLVSMVILSVGVLALSVLQLSSLQNTQGGHMRSQATMLAYDIIDAMRANSPAVVNNDYALGLQEVTPQAIDCYGMDANCTPTDIANSDLNRWRTVLGMYLPGGTGQIETNAVGGAIATAVVTVQWTDPYSAGDGAEQVVLQAAIR